MKREMRGIRTQNLTEMLNYCENVSVCQRKVLVEYFGEIYDANECVNGIAPCQVCMMSSDESNQPYKLYDFTDEALAVLNTVLGVKDCTLNYLAELYRGKKTKANMVRAERNFHHDTEMFGRGRELSDTDSLRFLRKLTIDGYLSELMKQSQHNTLYAYIELGQRGRQFLNSNPSNREKIYFHVSTKCNSKSDPALSFIRKLVPLSEAAALKDKYRLKHIDLFDRCRAELRGFFTKKAMENQFHNLTAIISAEGIEQIAALMPRTKTELLLIDSMTKTKVNCYGDQIMQIVEKYWPRIDEREHNEICNQLRILKDQRVEPRVDSGVINIDSSVPTLSYQYQSNVPNLRRVNSASRRRRGGYGNMAQARSKASRKK